MRKLFNWIFKSTYYGDGVLVKVYKTGDEKFYKIKPFKRKGFNSYHE